MTSKPDIPEWLPLDFAAELIGKRAEHIRGQLRAGKLTRGLHFRRARSGGIELNVEAYVTWVDSERMRRWFEKGGLATNTWTPRQMPSAPSRVVVATGPKLIPIAEWARQMFGQHQPCRGTLMNWIHAGRITPPPVKVGHRYFCSPDARYVDPKAERIRRLVEGI